MEPFIFYIIRITYLLFAGQLGQANLEANHRITTLVKQADCDAAIRAFQAMDSSSRILPETRLIITDCFFEKGDTAAVKDQLRRLEEIRNPEFLSATLSQKAMLKAVEKDTLEAINLYKKAIEIKNDNTFAKHNYEYLSKVYRPNRNESVNTPNSSNSKDENEGGKVEKNDRKDDLLDTKRDQEINLSQAMQILDAMKSSDMNRILILPAAEKDTAFYGNQ